MSAISSSQKPLMRFVVPKMFFAIGKTTPPVPAAMLMKCSRYWSGCAS